jgi:hypothetical protein
VSGKRLEDLTVHRLEKFPIEEPEDPLRAERTDLDQLALRALIAEPCIARAPTDRCKYHLRSSAEVLGCCRWLERGPTDRWPLVPYVRHARSGYRPPARSENWLD